MRKENWRGLLNDKIEQWRELDFQWGVSDCMQFVADCIGEILEGDFLSVAQPLGRYSSEQEAIDLLNQLFNGDLANMFDAFFLRHQNKTMAKPGDAVLVEINDKKVCGIIDLSGRRAVCKSEGGLAYIPIKYVLTSWSVD